MRCSGNYEGTPDLHLLESRDTGTFEVNPYNLSTEFYSGRNSPKCATNQQIDEWLFDISNSPNFVSFDHKLQSKGK